VSTIESATAPLPEAALKPASGKGWHQAEIACIIYFVSSIDRDGLLVLLDAAGDPLASKCAEAVREGGEVTIWDVSEAPASHLANIYRRRRRALRHVNVRVQGIDEAIRRFEEMQQVPMGLAIVHGGEDEFPIFFDADGMRLVACLSVPVRSA